MAGKKKFGRQGEGGGAPKKLVSEEVLAALEVILTDDANAIMCTDADLLILLNERLPADRQISKSSLEKWKTGTFGQWDEKQINLWGLTEADFYEKFLRLIERALVRMKTTIYGNITDCSEKTILSEDGTMTKIKGHDWHPWAWILERKFAEWNLRSIQDIEVKAKKSIGEVLDSLEEPKAEASRQATL